MPSLFYLPKVASLASSKLYFFQTATATPQNVYTDAGLTVAHSVPVVADASGVFAPIYLDPRLPNYRVTHKTSADVLIYTVDDVPSNQNTTTAVRIESTTPELWLYDTNGTVNARKYRIRVNGQQFEIGVSNDAESSVTAFISYDPANNGTLTLNGLTPLNGVGGKTLNGSSVSGTTLASDSDLLIALEGGSVYALEGLIDFQGSVGGGASGAKFGFTYSGSMFSQSACLVDQYANGAGSVLKSSFTSVSPLTIATISETANGNLVRFTQTLRTTTAGTLTLQRAQNSAAGGNLVINGPSWIRAHRVSGIP